MREKYVEERFNRWFVFGQRADGSVDVSGADCDVFEGIPPAAAEKFIAARNAYVDALVAMFTEYPDTLYKLGKSPCR